jgi:hypothetical protein
MRIADFDPLDLFDEHGYPLSLDEVPEDARKAIAALEVEEEYRPVDPEHLRDGEKRLVVVRKYRFNDRLAAYDKLMKHLGLLKEKVEVKHSGSLEHYLALAHARRKRKAEQ